MEVKAEETPTSRKPVLILRNKTERFEVLEAGGATLVGTDHVTTVNEVAGLIEDNEYYTKMADGANPFRQF